MKHLLSYTLIAFLLMATNLIAQETYTVNGEQLTLKTEVDGTITLLWNTLDGEYRYFIKKGTTITELTNTKVDKNYQEEYKQLLQAHTSDVDLSEDKVSLTTKSLSEYFTAYNKLKDPTYIVVENNIKLKTRLGVFAGITNSIYSKNPDNSFLPVLGLDFEIVDDNFLKRHSFVFQFKQTFESSDYKYSASEFSFNYRFKFVKKEKLDVFINTKVAGYSHENIPKLNEDLEIVITTEDSFSALLNFGIGADYALGNGYLTFLYGDIVSIVEGNNGEFPLDFTLGYKLNL
ncbi:MAG: hypothetical protein IMY67_05030 [Bacteroidetes bacterium]|nr:hypothetical protein [Bacteroidota bacterium]